MDGQVDFTIAERSRLLAGNRPPVSLSSLGTSFQEGHGLTRPPQGLSDLPPGATPSSLTSIGPFPGRYLPSISMHSTASSLAVMGSYLGSSHSDSLKSLVPDSLSQYWAAAHAEGLISLFAFMACIFAPVNAYDPSLLSKCRESFN